MSELTTRVGMPANGIDELSRQARALWAKTDPEDDSLWLPLHIHLSDTARTMVRLWDGWVSKNVKNLFARHCHGSEVLARKALVFLAGAHDIGKATPIFQAKPCGRGRGGERVNLAWKPEKAGLFIEASLSTTRDPTHPIAGQVLVTRYLQDMFGWSSNQADAWGSIVGAHHGNVPDKERVHKGFILKTAMGDAPDDVGKGWRGVQRELLDYAFHEAGLSNEDMASLALCAWDASTDSVACGLLIMADWIASNQDLFPLVPLIPGEGSTRSFMMKRDGASLDARADRAWLELDLPSSWSGEKPVVSDSWFCERFGLSEGCAPRSVQKAVMEAAAQMTEPSLMVIEAPMGEGKTEAALAAAEIVGAQFGCGGVCVALPTMATTDAMFGRVRRWLDHLAAHDSSSIYLAHGKAQLNEEYQGIVRSSRTYRSLSSMGVDLDEETPRDDRVVVSDWMQGRKKGMLANFVVCTVDQVLMGALDMRHLSLRQLALAGKVVIVDECHAYDSYMQQYLLRVLEWLAAWGCPVILLSATLPTSVRDSLIDAYREGRAAQGACPVSTAGFGDMPTTSSRKLTRKERARSRGRKLREVQTPVDESYPLITIASERGIERLDCPATSRSAQIDVSILQDEPDALVALMKEKLSEGGIAGVVCDTVTRAQMAYRALRGCFDSGEVMLAHARFMDLDRMENETVLRNLLGPDATRSNGKRPERMIVVGTQVLEQSLDIDFDLLVTDIAPIDLLMQRLGRAHRHVRGEGEKDRPVRLRKARCFLRGIEEIGPEGPVFAPGVSKVYDKASLMEALAVSGLGDMDASARLCLPQDIARLVRLAYSSTIEGRIPEGWLSSYLDACEERINAVQDKKCRAGDFLLPSAKYLAENEKTLTGLFARAVEDSSNSKMSEDAGQRAVRDTQETVEVLLVRRRDGHVHLLPWVGDEGSGVERGQEVPTAYEPDRALSMVLAQCAVRLPLSLCRPQQLDRLIGELEDGCERWVAAWQDVPVLAGRLVLAMEGVEIEPGVLEATVLDQRVRYTREEGLSTVRRET
ncbi:CRISPR-associated helicase Cas3' [Enorma burkinafasonensis]|uniref:CRISPR-associated helicase Cas3' n=1 Tax=Enorma burkinafasonensis TaxID=2590867 RepID=UPI001FE523B2|nr:CRISPR-associated helicase Cas3' [Enorma burkinafasonensis]